MSETYKVDCECTNCDHKGQVELPKGTPVSALMECPNCGCQTAQKAVRYPVQELPKPWEIPYQPSIMPTFPPFTEPPANPWHKQGWTLTCEHPDMLATHN